MPPDSNVASDLAYYRSLFGLPACPAGTASMLPKKRSNDR
jgi:hypothetical protein